MATSNPMRRFRIGLKATLLFAVLTLPPLAAAGGGDSVSNAPDLVVGRPNDAHSKGADTWRVTLAFRDKLILDITAVSSNNSLLNCILVPSITDYTLDNTPCTNQHGSENR